MCATEWLFEAISFALKEAGEVLRAAPDIRDLSISYNGSVQLGTEGGSHLLTHWYLPFEAPLSQFPAATPESYRLPKLWH